MKVVLRATDHKSPTAVPSPPSRPASVLQTLVTMSELAADVRIVRIPKSVSILASLDAEEPLKTGRTNDPGEAAIELLGRFL
jgi:hypothetical protein